MKIRAMCTKGDEGGLCDLNGDLRLVEESATGMWKLNTDEMWCPVHASSGRCSESWKIIFIV